MKEMEMFINAMKKYWNEEIKAGRFDEVIDNFCRFLNEDEEYLGAQIISVYEVEGVDVIVNADSYHNFIRCQMGDDYCVVPLNSRRIKSAIDNYCSQYNGEVSRAIADELPREKVGNMYRIKAA